MAVYTIFLALGLPVAVRPILDNSNILLSSSCLYEMFYPGAKFDWRDQEMCEEAEALKDDSANIPLTFVGGAFHKVIVTEEGGNEDPDSVLNAVDGKWEDVFWLTAPPPHTKEVGVAHLTVCIFFSHLFNISSNILDTVRERGWHKCYLLSRRPRGGGSAGCLALGSSYGTA
jgi:hypothetical protein